MMSRLHRFWVFAFAGCCLIGQRAVAQDSTPTDRERQLEELVRSLNERVNQLEQRVNELRGTDTDAPAAARLEKLETAVEEIKQSQPTAEEMASVKKWASDPLTLRPFWKDGLRFENTDKSVALKIGGRIHADAAFFGEDGRVHRIFGDEFDDGVEFRRARLYIEGDIYDNIEFKAQYDFAGGDADFRDVYIGFTDLGGWGGLRFGQFKEPFSLEELTSSNYITFMERSVANAFSPARSTGVMWHRGFLEDRVTGAVGVFRNSDDFGGVQSDQEFAFTGRVTALPIYEDNGKRLVHLGLALTHQEYKDTVRFRSRPEANLAPRLVDTLAFDADAGHLVAVEIAYVEGPFSFQGEYMQAFIDGSNAPIRNSEFCGGYVQASYLLTGEHRPYKKAEAAFDRVRPLRNWGEDGGWGAWEVAARYSRISLNDGLIRGGRLEDFTLGLNWYLNPSVRWMWNYVLANPSRGGIVNGFETRIQIAF